MNENYRCIARATPGGTKLQKEARRQEAQERTDAGCVPDAPSSRSCPPDRQDQVDSVHDFSGAMVKRSAAMPCCCLGTMPARLDVRIETSPGKGRQVRSPWWQPWGTDVNLRLSPGRGDTIIQIPARSPDVGCVPDAPSSCVCPPDRQDQVDLLHDFFRPHLRGTDANNHSVVPLRKKSAASEARGPCSREQRILPDTCSVP